MEKIKILVVTTTGMYKMEGINTILTDYFSHFDKDRFEITALANGLLAPEVVSRYEKAGIRLLHGPDRKKNPLGYLKFLKDQARHYDIFYINGSSAIMALDLISAKAGGIEHRVVESHNTATMHPALDKALRPAFNLSYTQALACSNEAGKWMFGKKPYKLVKNGRSPAKYRFDPQIRRKRRKLLGLKDSTMAIGHVGNLNPTKNQAYLIRSFARLHEKNPDSHLFLSGTGFTEEDLRKLIDELGLKGSVTMLGKIDYVPELIQAMDVMALPSYNEGLPLVVVEWQMAGLPCVISDAVTRECAFSDLVEFLPLDAGEEVWADHILEAAKKGKPETRLADNEKILTQAMEAGFSLEHSAQDLQDFFVGLVDRKN